MQLFLLWERSKVLCTHGGLITCMCALQRVHFTPCLTLFEGPTADRGSLLVFWKDLLKYLWSRCDGSDPDLPLLKREIFWKYCFAKRDIYQWLGFTDFSLVGDILEGRERFCIFCWHNIIENPNTVMCKLVCALALSSLSSIDFAMSYM